MRTRVREVLVCGLFMAGCGGGGSGGTSAPDLRGEVRFPEDLGSQENRADVEKTDEPGAQDVGVAEAGPEVQDTSKDAESGMDLSALPDLSGEADSFVEDVGPEVPPGCKSDADCEDGILCTADSCLDTGECSHLPDDGLCGDGNQCTGEEACWPDQAGDEVGCVAGTAPDCDDGDDSTLDECDPVEGCVNTFLLPDPVEVVVGEEVEELVLEWPAGSSVSVEIFPAAFDPGTQVGMEPIGLKEIDKPLPGILIDGIAFKFAPSAPLKYPVPATIDYDYEINKDERYSLLFWNAGRQMFEPVPILAKDKTGNLITFSMREAGEYYLLYTYAEALFLKRTAQSQWQTQVEVEEWPGLILGQVAATLDAAECQIGPDDQAGTFVGVLGGSSGVEITTPSPGEHSAQVLEIYMTVLVTHDKSPGGKFGYGLVLWQQTVVDENPEGDQALLAKFAPIFQFAEGEQSFPTTVSAFLDATSALITPSGRLHETSGAAQVAAKMAEQGDRGAVLIFDGKAVPQPGGAKDGTVYGYAFDLGGKTVLVYSLHFPYSRILGPAADDSGTHRGDVRYVVVTVAADGTPESITMSQHLPGSTLEYLGDEGMPIWMLSSFNGGRLTLPWKDALRCKKSTADEGNEEHPWVFVGSLSHALYPRKGQYKVTLPGGASSSQFEETAGGNELAVWQPPGFIWACDVLPQYNLVTHASVQGLLSSSESGYLLFSGALGVSRHARNGLAPFGEAWYAPSMFQSGASTGSFDPGTNCYKCLSTAQVLGVDGIGPGSCFQNYFPYYCQCVACGAVIGKAFLVFPKGFECKDEEFCKKFDQKGLCKTGLKIDWYADVPFNGVVTGDKNIPWQAQVLVNILYPPTCYSSAENTTGVKAYLCATNACCWDTYGAVHGTCYPQL